MLTELGWNASVAQQIAQVKGAARLQDKEWGAMITWKYNECPSWIAQKKFMTKCWRLTKLAPNT